MLPCMNPQLHGATQRSPPYTPDNWPAIDISRHPVERSDEVLTPVALELLASLHRQFNPRRLQLLAQRVRRHFRPCLRAATSWLGTAVRRFCQTCC